MELTKLGRRWLYRGRRAHRLARLLNGLQIRLAARGIGPRQVAVLDVVGRRTGRTISFPVVVADLAGERYLVSMLGDNTNWVRNVRAAGGHAVLRHGRREVIHLSEVEPDRRAPVLRRYLELAPGARPHIAVAPGAPLEQFERIAARYPVFRIVTTEPADGAAASQDGNERNRRRGGT
jgi:deazaflavin-dependent oxidoreductase (nitroreductase family)